jgi:glucosamine--fructose-6-phosphate aminotransferase (isomerizing)
MHLEVLEKGGYEHFMLKEIYEQPQGEKRFRKSRVFCREARGSTREKRND